MFVVGCCLLSLLFAVVVECCCRVNGFVLVVVVVGCCGAGRCGCWLLPVGADCGAVIGCCRLYS